MKMKDIIRIEQKLNPEQIRQNNQKGHIDTTIKFIFY